MIAWRYYHFAELPSTQTFAKQYMACLRPGFSQDQGFLFTADAQTAGKGTKDRHWHSPAGGNIYATFAFFLPKNQNVLLPYFPQVGVISVVKVLEDYGLAPKIKWVNDVLLDGKKVAGILCESFSSKLFPQHFVILIGLGLNVHMTEADYQYIEQPVTSLSLYLKHHDWDREVLLRDLVDSLSCQVSQLLEQGFSLFKEQLKIRLRAEDLTKIT